MATRASFNSDRTIKMAFEEQEEEPVPFRLGIPQGSPLSPILFVIYAVTLNGPGHKTPMETGTCYVDDEIMIQGAKTQRAVAMFLQTLLDNHIARAEHLNIGFAVSKAELTHLIVNTNSSSKITDTTGITLYNSAIIPKAGIKSFGVWIDHHRSIKTHAAMAAAKTWRSAGFCC